MAPDASSQQSDKNLITTLDALEEIYGESPEGALKKEIDHISEEYRAFIEAAPFVVVATAGPEGLDCSPRGDPAGFIRVLNDHTVVIPDRRGNNRVDSLRNIVRDPRVSLLFLIPGIGETIRINGTAQISVDPELCASFAMQGKNPASVIVVTLGSIYYQCPKALVRSKLWDPASIVPRDQLPTTGSILEAITKGDIDGGAYDAAYPQRIKDTIY
ncbi:MAG: pyridoxamine 5'-phosphate oxidase family protein [Alphaproteobacteria bacterium]|nr:pyridoxamine 5'-phosphate oxidase family protein [Alphaproteobacteria bacterium]